MARITITYSRSSVVTLGFILNKTGRRLLKVFKHPGPIHCSVTFTWVAAYFIPTSLRSDSDYTYVLRSVIQVDYVTLGFSFNSSFWLPVFAVIDYLLVRFLLSLYLPIGVAYSVQFLEFSNARSPGARKEHRRFEGEPSSLRDGFSPPTAEPLRYVPRMLPHSYLSF